MPSAYVRSEAREGRGGVDRARHDRGDREPDQRQPREHQRAGRAPTLVSSHAPMAGATAVAGDGHGEDPAQLAGEDRSSRVTAIIAPPTTAGMPPPGCTDAPTRHSQGRQGSLYEGRWNGPLSHGGRAAP
jgi:hypothetical protein